MRERNLAYMKSFTLLTAVAFENLIKGLFVARKIDWRTATQSHHGGHGIASYVRQATTVSAEELDLLERLQEYLVWAGRYAIPMKEQRYLNGHDLQCLRSDDVNLIPNVFERLANELSTHAKANGF